MERLLEEMLMLIKTQNEQLTALQEIRNIGIERSRSDGRGEYLS